MQAERESTDRLEAIEALLQQVLERLTPDDRRFLNVEGAAAYSSMSPKSIRRMLEAAQLRCYRPRPGLVLLDRRELDAAILAATKRPARGRGRRRTVNVLEVSTNRCQ